MIFLRGTVIGTDKVELMTQEATIDTCFANDTNMYETAVFDSFNKTWYVMEYYPTRSAATAGHERWVAEATCRRKLKFFDPQMKEARLVR